MALQEINFRDRLEKVAEKLGAEAMLLMSQPEAVRNSDVGHSYRQESFLYYLTGVKEPNSALLICPQQKDGIKFVLFVNPKDPLKELWDGRRIGIETAKSDLAIDEAHSIDDLWNKIVGYVKGHTAMNYSLGNDSGSDQKLVDALSKIRRTRPRFFDYKMPIIDAAKIAGEMRQLKDGPEVERMQKAADITKAAFDKVYDSIQPGMNEKEIHGMLIGEFYKHGADMEAYGSIVAGGDNACILHYIENDAELNDNELILIDAGAQYDYYASDVTRTFPVGKTFTKPQKDLYALVLEANIEAIKMVKPGSTLPEVHDKAVDVLIKGMIELNLLQGSKEEILKSGSLKKYYPHNTSHWLGMDVHDVGAYQLESSGKWSPQVFEAGMVLTVEPGLYIPANDESVPAEYRGIGIRIEDDILVTESGNRNLTEGIPKDIASLENR